MKLETIDHLVVAVADIAKAREPLERLARLRIGVVPDRCPHERKSRLDREFLCGYRPKIRNRKRTRIGVAAGAAFFRFRGERLWQSSFAFRR